MATPRFQSVWDAIEDTPAEAENMKLRSELMIALKRHISRTELTQDAAAKLFGVTQPRVSDLMRGKIKRFSLDVLINMAAAAGMHIEMCACSNRSECGGFRISPQSRADASG
ncbi:helix-turn-helix domain-containing protein [Cupriavidus necator]